jgi:hypothetical protein
MYVAIRVKNKEGRIRKEGRRKKEEGRRAAGGRCERPRIGFKWPVTLLAITREEVASAGPSPLYSLFLTPYDNCYFDKCPL